MDVQLSVMCPQALSDGQPGFPARERRITGRLSANEDAGHAASCTQVEFRQPVARRDAKRYCVRLRRRALCGARYEHEQHAQPKMAEVQSRHRGLLRRCQSASRQSPRGSRSGWRCDDAGVFQMSAQEALFA